MYVYLFIFICIGICMADLDTLHFFAAAALLMIIPFIATHSNLNDIEVPVQVTTQKS